jgi:outer membrane protein assembly factor BamB
MPFTFSSTLPKNYREIAKVISGEQSTRYAGSEYLLVEDDKKSEVFQIKYEYYCGPFKEAAKSGNLLIVGHSGHFYLYDLTSHQNILALQMDGYFGHFYLKGEHIYVADSGTLFCIDRKGTTIWRNTNLGVDGVIIEKFTENLVFGSGEWDPPGGWVDFVLELKTGQKVKRNIG